MSPAKPDISVVETKDGFTLSAKDKDGSTTKFMLSPGQLITLAYVALPLLSVAHKKQSLGSESRAWAVPVKAFAVQSDALQGNVLLELISPTGTTLTYGFPLAVVEALIYELAAEVHEMKTKPPSTKQ